MWLDTNRDGTDDYVVLNRDASGLNTITDGRQFTWVLNLATNAVSAFFAEHSTNTGNTVLYICGEQIGMNAANLLIRRSTWRVAQDFYYGGPGDIVTGLTVTPLGERFYGVPSDVPGNSSNPTGLQVYDFGLLPGDSPERGLLLITNGDRGAGVRAAQPSRRKHCCSCHLSASNAGDRSNALTGIRSNQGKPLASKREAPISGLHLFRCHR